MVKLLLIVICFNFLLYEGKASNGGCSFDEPLNPVQTNPEDWQGVEYGLNFSFGTIDKRYNKEVPPEEFLSDSWSSSVWRGEKINLQILLWSKDDINNIKVNSSKITGSNGATISGDNISVHPVRYVLTDKFLSGCGYRDKDTIDSYLAADLLEYNQTINLQGKTTRPYWIVIDVPADTKAGDYKGEITLTSEGEKVGKLPLTLVVEEFVLPSASEWSFHLDLWQNPYAVARYYDVELWSQEHIDLLKPYLELLADAGQKCITTTILHRAWGGQTYDHFESMVQWTHLGDGVWEFDYSVFDTWVQLALDAGIDRQISCYSMIPWGNQIRYYDVDSADYVTVEARAGSKEYKELWEPFLIQFRDHLKMKGWLDITKIAMDERSLQEMESMISLLNEVTPEFEIAFAGNYHEEIADDISDLCVFVDPEVDSKVFDERREKGFLTTYYTCCAAPEHPNNFTFSPPAEQAIIGWYAAAKKYDGYLRWAYNSWVEDPLSDSRFRAWPAGDTYQVYPGPRSSIRFERLIEGIQDFEKIRLVKSALKKKGEKEKLHELEEMLNRLFSHDNTISPNAAKWINKGKKRFNEILGSLSANDMVYQPQDKEWELVWSDNFENEKIDNTKWNIINVDPDNYDRSPDWKKHMSDDNRLFLNDDGKLYLHGINNPGDIDDPRPFLTGGVKTKDKFSFLYGKIDIRAKKECATGAWPALWMMPQDDVYGGWPHSGEIDIMEHLNYDRVIHQTVHTRYTNVLGRTVNPPRTADDIEIDVTKWNLYGLEWYPNELVWTVNGEETFRYPRVDYLDADMIQWPFDQPFYIIMSQQLGGNWVGDVAGDELPVSLIIDYVKVYN
ncbi:DUF6067 family protein [Marinilabiliaceae bacterium ANBcel2]|nr:DUF6067 family protein [Marinilabiliaceae bacterium ANBcel2]